MYKGPRKTSALPGGSTVRDLVFEELAAPGLCLTKNASGAWKIRLITQRKDENE